MPRVAGGLGLVALVATTSIGWVACSSDSVVLAGAAGAAASSERDAATDARAATGDPALDRDSGDGIGGGGIGGGGAGPLLADAEIGGGGTGPVQADAGIAGGGAGPVPADAGIAGGGVGPVPTDAGIGGGGAGPFPGDADVADAAITDAAIADAAIADAGSDADSDAGACVAPPNTTCANGVSIGVGVLRVGDNTCSGAELAPAVSADCTAGDGIGNEVTYALASDGTPTAYTIMMTGDPGYDTLLHVHSSSACDATDQLACADDVPSVSTSQVTVNGLPSGATYYIVADGAAAGGGAFTLTTSSSAINHDTCASPAPIAGNGVFTGTTTGRVNNYTPPVACSSFTPTASPDVVFRLVARSNSTITASTSGTSFDTLLWVATTCGSGSIACNDDFASTVQSQISWAATAGTTYYLVIRGFDSTAQGSYSLTISGY